MRTATVKLLQYSNHCTTKALLSKVPIEAAQHNTVLYDTVLYYQAVLYAFEMLALGLTS